MGQRVGDKNNNSKKKKKKLNENVLSYQNIFLAKCTEPGVILL